MEGEIDDPPVDVRDFEELGTRGLKSSAFAKGPVGAGLVVIERAVAVDNVDGADAAVQLVEKCRDAAAEVSRSPCWRAPATAHI